VNVARPVEENELQLLRDWGALDLRPKPRYGFWGTVGVHLAALIVLLVLPESVFEVRKPREAHTKITPLFLPRMEITQTDPNTQKPAKSFNLESLLPRPKIQMPDAPKSTTRPSAPRPGLAEIPRLATPKPKEIPLPAPPPGMPNAIPQENPLARADIAQVRPPEIKTQEPPPPEKPRLAFENPHAQPLPGMPGSQGKVQVPSVSVDDAVRSLSGPQRGPRGGLMVGDLPGGVGGYGEGINMPPSPGKNLSGLELLSDPMGVDFRPYLIRVLTSVRRNWFAVMPESAKLGRRGKVEIQFAIDREGRVPKLVIVASSGADPLDRAAVAGISASNPFPPLPTEFRGAQIRLQFTFAYNMPSR
jgi:TonB family protein